MSPPDDQDLQDENIARLLFRLLVAADVLGLLIVVLLFGHF